MTNVLKELLKRRRYLDAEHFDILDRYATCQSFEISLMQSELDGNQVLLSSINEQIKEQQEQDQ